MNHAAPQPEAVARAFRVVMRAPLSLSERLAVVGELLRVLRQRWRLCRGDILHHVRPVLVAAGVPKRLVRRRPPRVSPEAPPTADESAATEAVR